MALSLLNGPLARTDGVETNYTIDGPKSLLYLHSVPSRIRALVDGVTVVDTGDAVLLHETGLMPTYYLPRDDVRFDLLTPNDHQTHCPYKGDARYWDLTVGDRTITNAVWGYDEPLEDALDLSSHVAFYFHRMDAWFEEDEELHGHPRDPFHRIDIRPSHRTVKVLVDGEEVASSDSPLALFETGLPVRWYLPAEDWVTDRMSPSATTAVCAYKGHADYAHISTAAGLVEDVAWRYRDPLPDGARVLGRWAAAESDRVEIVVSDPVD